LASCSRVARAAAADITVVVVAAAVEAGAEAVSVAP
jgi:hypothetical protein